ncbi:hypothetical protein JKP88DRAFT_289945 [Tribonema minus]|uniref:Uncharacterized protein n=1 Tax=Tribonema minus TaxID=303371 RepID=A0A835YZV9_9STRA|nr:hypothetical protein JKP88DRAFT_289945 [Tribonema minus]
MLDKAHHIGLVPLLVLEVRLDPRVLTVVEDRASMGLSREVLMETLQDRASMGLSMEVLMETLQDCLSMGLSREVLIGDAAAPPCACATALAARALVAFAVIAAIRTGIVTPCAALDELRRERAACASGYTVVNRDAGEMYDMGELDGSAPHVYSIHNTGEIYDMGELDGSAPYRYSILPSGIQVPTKARTLLGINQTKTCVMGHFGGVTHVRMAEGDVMGHFGGVTHVRMAEGDVPISGKAARMLGIQPMRKAASHASVLEEAASWRESAKRRSTSSGPVPPLQRRRFTFSAPVPPLQRRRPEDDGDDWGYAPSPIRHVSFAAEAQRQPQRQQQAAAPPPPAAPVSTISRKRTPEGQPVVSPTIAAAAEMPPALWRKQSRGQPGCAAA